MKQGVQQDGHTVVGPCPSLLPRPPPSTRSLEKNELVFKVTEDPQIPHPSASGIGAVIQLLLLGTGRLREAVGFVQGHRASEGPRGHAAWSGTGRTPCFRARALASKPLARALGTRVRNTECFPGRAGYFQSSHVTQPREPGETQTIAALGTERE